MTKLFNSVFIMAFMAVSVCGQLYEKDTTPSSGWFGGLFHHGDKSSSLMPYSMEWSTEVPVSSTPSSYWSYFGLGHRTTPSSLLRFRRAPQHPYYPNRPYYRQYNQRPYNPNPYQAYNRGGNQVVNRPYYQRPVETTTQDKTVYMPGNGPDMPVASSTFAPQFGWGVTYKNGATVKPTTSTANPAAAWYQNWLNSLPDSLKSLYGITTTVPPQGLVGRRRRRSAEDIASTNAISDATESSTESIFNMEEDTSTEALIKATKIAPRIRRAVEISSSTQGPIEMIAIEGQKDTSTLSSQEMKFSSTAPTL